MEMTPVSHSSNIEALGYEEDTRLLHVRFVGRKGAPGSLYEFAGVPIEVWHGLLHAVTKGGYFSANIKGKFPSTKLS